ncbi:hypothetical protein [Rubrivivax albus]|uniref:Uncharacterized protein n=1 Tax=Rubrivivax albus TaxID=2499835 RepID=A0A437K093_9BURK|nr:hypothetical protein [Rubrivivax albus]RVT53665.1 hypothetical protein ENE75_01870 [Rubrivivax albus]
MTAQPLQIERQYLVQLLEAVKRCCFHLHASARKLPWLLNGQFLYARRNDTDLFEAMAAFNEYFAKLRDTQGAVLRHAALLMGETTSPLMRSRHCSRNLASSNRWRVGNCPARCATFQCTTTTPTTP